MTILALAAFEIFARAGIDLDLITLLDKQRNLYRSAGFYNRWLEGIGCGVALEARIGLGDLEFHKERGFYCKDIALVGQYLYRNTARKSP